MLWVFGGAYGPVGGCQFFGQVSLCLRFETLFCVPGAAGVYRENGIEI